MEKNSSELTIIRDEPSLSSAIWSNAVIWFFGSKLDAALLDKLEQDVPVVRERMTSDYGTLTILVGEKREPPSEEARKRLAEILKQSSSLLVAKATVLESKGFTATVSRSAITDIEVATHRRETPHHIFSNVREATGWLAQMLGQDRNWARELHNVVTEQRERLKGRTT